MTTTTADQPRPGHPNTRRRKVQRVQTTLGHDSRLTIQDISVCTGVPWTTVHRILHKDLKMSKLSAKFVPCILSDEQKRHRKTLCENNLRALRADPDMLEKVITCDESWLSVYEPDTKQDSAQWLRRGSAHPQKARHTRATKKTMLVLFFDSAGPVHTEFVPTGDTVDTDLWIAILRNLRESIHCKRPIMWTGGFDGNTDHDFLLHMDNASYHVSVPALAYYGENDINLLSHPAYSPDLAPCDFWAFPTLKAQLRGTKFNTLDQLKTEAKRVLRSIPAEQYQNAIYDMAVRWSICVMAEGEYFEGQNIAHNPAHLPPEENSDSDSD